MSERIVDNPANHGWVEENGKWVWEGGATTGHIADGTVQGQVTTWNVAQEAWTPESSLTIEASGNATLSGSLSVDGLKNWKWVHNNDDQIGLTINAGINRLEPFGNSAGAMDLGASTAKFKDAYFSGTVDAAGVTVNGLPISGGGGGLPDGGYTYNWEITATDFIATSDERLKDNITTAPVGLIDSLKGREWDWSESGEKGSGVVAQELEQVLPHLVHTDDEGMKSVAYNGLIAYLIEEIKDLKAQVEALK